MKRIVSGALLPLLALGVLASSRPSSAVRTVRGTVHAVHPKTSTVEVVTGVGMALRLVRLQAVPTTKITRGGAGVELGTLKRGDVVRAECHGANARLVVDRIEKVVVP